MGRRGTAEAGDDDGPEGGGGGGHVDGGTLVVVVGQPIQRQARKSLLRGRCIWDTSSASLAGQLLSPVEP